MPSDNATIFELIKVDILLNLFLCGELDAEKIDLKTSYFQSTLRYIKRKPDDLVRLIANLLPLLSIDPTTNFVLNGFKEGTNKVIDFLAEIKKIKVEMDDDIKSNETNSKDFIEAMTLMKGTYLEFDLISQIIQNTIEKSEKEFVLVVDDLDRLDPAHILKSIDVLFEFLTKEI